MRNIEIKAKVDNIEEIERKAKKLSDSPLVVINQRDIFFNLPDTQTNAGGRLKLREFQDGTAELIFYQRPNIKGPQLSVYSKIQLNLEKCKELKEILTEANGVLGIITKTRHLYVINQTRIHIDYVFELGTFIELEIVLDDSDDLKNGEKIVEKQMKILGISESSLLSGSYLDMMNSKVVKNQ